MFSTASFLVQIGGRGILGYTFLKQYCKLGSVFPCLLLAKISCIHVITNIRTILCTLHYFSTYCPHRFKHMFHRIIEFRDTSVVSSSGRLWNNHQTAVWDSLLHVNHCPENFFTGPKAYKSLGERSMTKNPCHLLVK